MRMHTPHWMDDMVFCSLVDSPLLYSVSLWSGLLVSPWSISLNSTSAAASVRGGPPTVESPTSGKTLTISLVLSS